MYIGTVLSDSSSLYYGYLTDPGPPINFCCKWLRLNRCRVDESNGCASLEDFHSCCNKSMDRISVEHSYCRTAPSVCKRPLKRPWSSVS
ncbi:hypothetical protein RB195_021568 [Necator americanus]|uniref:Phospholipase A2 n=1 Tax=Necator americanus TaxID=51031 RepID=A0ABR1EBZ9_NECAM